MGEWMKRTNVESWRFQICISSATYLKRPNVLNHVLWFLVKILLFFCNWFTLSFDLFLKNQLPTFGISHQRTSQIFQLSWLYQKYRVTHSCEDFLISITIDLRHSRNTTIHPHLKCIYSAWRWEYSVVGYRQCILNGRWTNLILCCRLSAQVR